MKPIEKSGEASIFQQRIYDALDVYETLYQEARKQDTRPPKLSISGFVKHVKISRSVLYGKHKHLIVEIEERFKLLACEGNINPPSKKPTLESMRRELVSVRSKAKLDLETAHSGKMQEFIETFSPAMRDATQMMIERQQHIRTIDNLRKQLANALEINRKLLAQTNN